MSRHYWIGLLLALALTGCGSAAGVPSVPSDNPTITLGQEFQVAVGHTATLSAGNVRVVFNGVSEDSRCPAGAQCAWAGQAVVQISVSLPNAQPVGYNLVLGGSVPASDTAAAGLYSIRLRALDPLGAEGETIRPGDYVATLLITKR